MRLRGGARIFHAGGKNINNRRHSRRSMRLLSQRNGAPGHCGNRMAVRLLLSSWQQETIAMTIRSIAAPYGAAARAKIAAMAAAVILLSLN